MHRPAHANRPPLNALLSAAGATSIALLAVCLASGNVHAQAGEAAPTRADIPSPPPLLTGPNDERLEPTVTIRKEGDREVEEYRLRGRLFAIRVKVKGAPPYWLVDPDGSGRMVPGQSIGPTISVPKWVVREF